jgi:tRNA-2-methylthio-N6-dimethylallyladenosine synthase
MREPTRSRRVYLETYGCQMNVADSELVGGILHNNGYAVTTELDQADVVLLNTCAIREHAEQRIRGRLGSIRARKRANPDLVVGILGCMAERLRSRFLDQERLVDIVVGPDEYRKLPLLVENAFAGEKGVAVRLSRIEDYDDIAPLRTDGISAWISVMRGCDKFCTFCVVPFTRGRERSRPLGGVLSEVRDLVGRGFREVTLLGQNVNSYRDGSHDFADLIREIAAVDPQLRVRFTTSHPQDMSDRLIDTIAATPNICKAIHLPVQSGSDRILRLMNRTYTVEHYLRRVERLQQAIPRVSLSTDLISGFPSESEEDHAMTVELLTQVGFDGAYCFKYSRRENTRAWTMEETVSDEEKGRRVTELTRLQQAISRERNEAMVGTVEDKVVIFPHRGEQPGTYVRVRIERANSATLFGSVVQYASAEGSTL